MQKEDISTTQYTPKEIIEIFSYDTAEREAFTYLRRYMKLIDKSLEEIENDEQKLKRFALAGLFLTYRACNHSGGSMNTENLGDFDSDSVHQTRLIIFRDYFKAEIKSANHYLKLINFSAFDYILLIFRLRSLPRKLYKFVVK